MTLFKNKYRIETIRLKNWDYSNEGYYFITICTKNNQCLFGEIINQKMILSDVGEIAYQNWLDIPNHFSNVELDEFVIMPNHIHGIMVLNSNKEDSTNSIDLSKDTFFSKIASKKNSLSVIIRTYKASVSRNCKINNLFMDWLPRFYENIIRDERALENIRGYIINNPINWEKDKNYLKDHK